MKAVTILGSTGSIGRQTLDVIRKLKFKVKALSANRNIELLEKQIKEFKPEVVAVMDRNKAAELQRKVGIEVYEGLNGLIEISKYGDLVVNSLVGSVGVLPTINAIENGKDIALANKECLVIAGSFIMKLKEKMEVNLIPIDSEHSAIFQCIEALKRVNRIILTCSGGPFRDLTKAELENVTVEDALKHPTWDMGKKITVDSATLMNKGFEVIEAHHLFNLPYEKIEVVIHPQSIVHGMVEFCDHSIKAQLSIPDMRIAIQYALTYPERVDNEIRSLDLNALEFKKPNLELFPCLGYAYEAGKLGGSLPAVLNAANEVAVEYFINKKIKFLDIPKIIRIMMDKHKIIKHPDLEEILDIDCKTKVETKRVIESFEE